MSITNIVSSVGGISSVSNAGGMEHYTAATSTCMLHTSLLITYGNFS